MSSERVDIVAAWAKVSKPVSRSLLRMSRRRGIEEVGFTKKSDVKIRGSKHTVNWPPPLTNIPVKEGECLEGDLGGGQ